MRLPKSFTSFAVAFEAASCPAFTSAMPPCAAFVMKSLSASLSDAAEVAVVDVVADVSVADVLVALAEVSDVTVSDVAVSFFLHPNAIKETIAKRKSKLRLIGSTPSTVCSARKVPRRALQQAAKRVCQLRVLVDRVV